MEKRWEWLGKKIRKRRKELGFRTQKDLSEALETDQTRVSRWESGEEAPRNHRAKLMEVLKVDEKFFAPPIETKQSVDPVILDAIERSATKVFEARKSYGDLTKEEQAVLRVFNAAEPIQQAAAMWFLTGDRHYVDEYNALAAELTHAEKIEEAEMREALGSSVK